MTYPRRKYRNVPTEYKGRRYDSKAEAQFAERLDLDPDVVWWLRQVSFDLGEDDRYRADFLVYEAYGTNHRIYAVDVKGVETASFRRHKRLWKKYAPVPLHIVKKGQTAEIIDGQLEQEIS